MSGPANLSFDAYVESLSPLHWWSLDEASGTSTAQDDGTSPQNGTYAGGSATAVLNSAITAEAGDTKRARAIYGDTGSSMVTSAPLALGVGEGQQTPGFSLVFWTVQGENFSRRDDDLLGLTEARQAGFYVSIRNNALTFIRPRPGGRDRITLDAGLFAEPSTLASAGQGSWRMVVFTVDGEGNAKGYVGGTLRETARFSGGGVIAPTSPSSRFKIGHLGYGDTAPEQGFDEVLIWNRALTDDEIRGLYLRSLYGSVYETAGVDGTAIDLASLGGWRISPSRLPALTSPQDVTAYVSSWEVLLGVDDIAPGGQIQGYDDGPRALVLARSLAPGKMVVLETARFNDETQTYGEWEKLGVFLSEGVRAQTEAGTGATTRMAAVYAPARQLGYNPVFTGIMPDKMEFVREKMVLKSTTDETLTFVIPRPDSAQPYTQLAPSPTPVIEASKFRNLDKSLTDSEQIDAADVPARIAIKSAQGAIQVVGGPGEIRIDRTFYENPLSSGMGNPDPDGGVHITCARDLTYEDVVFDAKVASLASDDRRWLIEVAGVSNPGYSSSDLDSVNHDPGASVVYSDTGSGDWGHSGSVSADAAAPFGDFRYTDENTQTATFTSPGGGKIGFYARRGPNGGLMVVEVDGGATPGQMLLPTMKALKESSAKYSSVTGIDDDAFVYDCYTASASEQGIVICAEGLDGSVAHTLTLTSTDQAHADSSASRAFVSGFASPTPVGPTPQSVLPTRMFVHSGVCKGRVYQLHPLLGREGYRDTGTFTTAEEGTSGTTRWGTTAGAVKPTSLPGDAATTFAGDGAALTAVDGADTSAFAGPCSTYTEKTRQLIFSGIDANAVGQEDHVVAGLEVRVKRWAYIESSAIAFSDQPGVFVDWHPNGLVSEVVVQFELDGTLTGDNKADATRTASSGIYEYPNMKTTNLGAADNLKSFGGQNDKWGLTEIRVRDLSRLKLRLQAEFRGTGAVLPIWAGVREVEVRVWTSSGSTFVQKFTITNDYGFPVNPHYEGLAVGDTVQVGNANRPEDVLRILLFRQGFQTVDPTLPFYVNVEDMPRRYRAIMPEAKASLNTPRTPIEIIGTDILNAAIPSYKIFTDRQGALQARVSEQLSQPQVSFNGVIEQSRDAGGFQVYTSAVMVSEGGESLNLARQAALRAIKLDGFSTEGSTSTGSGINSQSGLGYSKSDSGQAAANARLTPMIDGSSRTPVLDGGGWDQFNSLGVLWSAFGPKVEPWTWEDQPLFMMDLGPWGGSDPFIEAIHGLHFQTYSQKEGVPMVISVWVMDSAGYARETSQRPPETANQVWADKAVSYFPDPASIQWRRLVDKVQVRSGDFQIEADLFEEPSPAKARFLMFVLHQGHYFDGDGERDQRRMRAGFTEVRVYGSKQIVASATLGGSVGLDTGSMKALIGQLGRRTAVLQPNYLSTYEDTVEFVRQQLDELRREFIPTAYQIPTYPLDPGMTVAVYDTTLGVSREVYVQGVKFNSRGLCVVDGVDYNDEPYYVDA